MLELPLFPLQTVLFPGTPIRLHIFEERYKRMINLCLQQKMPFGVVLIRHGTETFGPIADPHEIGTFAQIKQVQRFPDGRMNLQCTGLERFRIISLERDLLPYLIGYVEAIESDQVKIPEIGLSVEKLREWLSIYISTLAQHGVDISNIDQNIQNPTQIAYSTASILQLTNEEKQNILSLVNSLTLVNEVIKLLRREIAISRSLLSRAVQVNNVFSIN